VQIQSSYGVGRYHAGEGDVLLRARHQPPSGLGRGCIFCWGHGNSSPIVVNDAYWNGVGRAPARTGIPTVTADFGGQLWGNDTQVGPGGRMDEAWTLLKANGAATDKVFLLGVSMGALLCCNWARLNPTKVAAMALVTPAVDLANVHNVTRPDLAAEINTAYTDAAGYAAALPTHNPAQYAASLSGLPVKAWYSTDDTNVTASTVTAFAAAVGTSAQVVNLGAVGHSAGTMDPLDVATFFQSYA
jgi:pimeloyl-ACP methyl ester carboxylesterase